MNVIFVSHCGFTGNSSLHVYSIAVELHRRGLSPAIAVPDNPKGVRDLGRPPFPVLSYRDVRRGELRFPDGRGVDIVHAFTPRELVRRLTLELVRDHSCPYVMHLEDNEEAIVSNAFGGRSFDELGRLPAALLDARIDVRYSHPLYAPAFVAGAAGITAVVDRLLEFKPDDVPGVVVWPGFDEGGVPPQQSRAETRAALRLHPEQLALVYTGNIHASNLREMRSLYLAVALLRRAGYPVVLVKTGWNHVDMSLLPDLGDGVRDLGYVRHGRIPSLLAAADILVQPGRSDRYNDYRFPSKLPEFLASGRPVVLPRANLGLHLEDGGEALLLERGNAPEIFEKVALLADDSQLRALLGERGRAFALRELRWSRNVEPIVDLYRRINQSRVRSAVPGRTAGDAAAVEVSPLVKLIALTPPGTVPEPDRGHGIYGFCFSYRGGQPTPERPQIPFCYCWESESDHPDGSSERAIEELLPALSDPRYICVEDAPLLLVRCKEPRLDTAGLAQRWRETAKREAGMNLHLALVERFDGRESPDTYGFDAAVELPPYLATADDYEFAMAERLARPLPDFHWYRSVTPSAVGVGGRRRLSLLRAASQPYEIWLRKLVMQTLYRATLQEPLVLVDVRNEPADSRWLDVTRSALRDGLRQFYASQGFVLSPDQAKRLLGASAGPT